MPSVVCAGVVTVDALALVETYPGPDERVLSEEIMIVGGGPAGNAAVVLARQGVPVAFVGRVGADPAGEQAIALLAAEGVDVSGVQRDPSTHTQSSCVVVSRAAQTRAISTLAVPPLTELSPVAQDLVAQADWVHADHLGYGPTAAFLGRLRSRPRFALDAGNEIANLDVAPLDLYVPTVTSLIARYGRPADQADAAAAQALSEGARAVVATAGSAGSWAWWSGAGAGIGQAPGAGTVQIPACTGVPIVSTLGAGDVFHGALLSALCRDLPWDQALRAANTTAALSCRALDGRSAVPTLAELDAVLDIAPDRAVPAGRPA